MRKEHAKVRTHVNQSKNVRRETLKIQVINIESIYNQDGESGPNLQERPDPNSAVMQKTRFGKYKSRYNGYIIGIIVWWRRIRMKLTRTRIRSTRKLPAPDPIVKKRPDVDPQPWGAITHV